MSKWLGRWKESARKGFWAGVLFTALLLLVSFSVWVLWSVPSYATRTFTWEDLERGAPFNTTATMFATFGSDGPFAVGSSIRVVSAVLYVQTPKTPSGMPEITIDGDNNATGRITLKLPELGENFGFLYRSSTEVPFGTGALAFSSPGQAGLRAHVKILLDGSPVQGWAQYFESEFDPPETWIDLGPPSDLYTFLGLKATAVGLLMAAASQIFPAIESASALYHRKKGS